MLRIFVAFLLLAAPTAAAGVHVEADALPSPTDGCTSASDGYGWWSGSSDNGSYWYEQDNAQWSQESCASSAPIASVNVTSNDHDAVSAGAGSGFSSSDGESWAAQSAGHGYTWNESSYWAAAGSGSSSDSSTWRSGSEASVDSFAGGASYFDGCAGSSYQSSQYQYESWAYSSPTEYSSGSSDHSAWNAYDTQACGRSVAVETDVADAEAGRATGCTTTQWGAWDSSTSWQQEENSYHYYSANETSSDCADEIYVTAGEERISAGTYTQCESWTYDLESSGWNGTHYGHHDACTTRTGAFGPDGLGVYREDSYDSFCSGTSEEACTGWSSEWHAIGAEHDLTGGTFFTLP